MLKKKIERLSKKINMELGFSLFEKKLMNYFFNVEIERKKQRQKSNAQNILPKHILRRRIKIITNGEIIFDSAECKDDNIPMSIQYTIKKYGLPNSIKPDNKTPIIYNITSNASSIFPMEDKQHN